MKTEEEKNQASKKTENRLVQTVWYWEVQDQKMTLVTVRCAWSGLGAVKQKVFVNLDQNQRWFSGTREFSSQQRDAHILLHERQNGCKLLLPTTCYLCDTIPSLPLKLSHTPTLYLPLAFNIICSLLYL